MKNLLRKYYRRIKIARKVNWYKTIYFNFKKLPFKIALKLPVFFYGKVKFTSIDGCIDIRGNIKTAMIGFGQNFDFPTTSGGTAELLLEGKLIFEDYAHIGKDFAISVKKGAVCKFGYMSCLGSRVKLVCTESIEIGEWTGIGYESQVIDTNSHPMKNSLTNEYYPTSLPIKLGSYNAISNRVTIMQGCETPDNIVIASNSLCNKNYRNLGTQVLIGGIPAKLLKNDFIRDFENEKELLKKYKVINF